MKKIITLLFMVGFFITAYPQSYHTITIDGTNSGWTTSETFTDCSSADNAYFTWDADYLYFGISDPEADYGNMATFMYFDTDPDGTSGTTNAYAWTENITTPFNADYVVVWKNNTNDDYIEVRHWDGSNWIQVASSNSSSLNSGDYGVNFSVVDGNDYREVKVKRSTIGSPSAIKVASFTEQQWGSNWRYFAWPSEDWTDANRASGQSILHYRGFILTDNVSPNTANYYDDNIYSWTGSTDNDWGTSTNWSGSTTPASSDLIIIGSGNAVVNESPSTPGSCFDLLIKSGSSLTINTGKALTVTGNLTNNGTLTIASDNTGTGSLIVSGSVTGNATVQRYMTTYTSNSDGWHFLSAPVSNFTISGSDFEPGTGEDLYEFSESATSEPWLNYNGGTFGDTEFQTGKGYLVAYSGTAATKSFTGTINTGTVTKNLSFTTGSAGEGWNLLGNPYTSAIDWDLLSKSSDNVSGTVYVLQASDGTYVSWNGSTGSLSDGIIPAMQGFFVHTTATGESVTMVTADQVHQTTAYYKASRALTENTLKITLSNSEANNNTYIQIRDDATRDFDNAIDGYKLFGFGSTPELYTQIDNTKYSINCLPTSLSNYSLPIGLKIKADGNYNLSFAGLDTFANGIDLVLEDKNTGEMTTITNGVTIPFHFSSDDDPNRFVLHINGVTAVPKVNQTDGVQVFAYGKTVYLHGQQSLNGNVSIFNTLGQQVYTGVLNGAAKQQIRLNQQHGVYFVRLKENNRVITKKIFIQ